MRILEGLVGDQGAHKRRDNQQMSPHMIQRAANAVKNRTCRMTFNISRDKHAFPTLVAQERPLGSLMNGDCDTSTNRID